MKFELWTIGKTKEEYLKQGINHALSKISHYIDFQYFEITNIKYKTKKNVQLIKQTEKEVLLKRISGQDVLILLDEKGKIFSSLQFAEQVERMQHFGSHRHVFLIGGAYGFDPEIVQRANMKIALSAMTFSHQFVRLIFLKQFYRALTIIKGEKFHHE